MPGVKREARYQLDLVYGDLGALSRLTVSGSDDSTYLGPIRASLPYYSEMEPNPS
jgi:hypothetical protein